MKVYVAFDGDHIGRMIGRMALADKPEEVRKLSQSIDRGNEIWRSWAMAQGGSIISIGGDEGRLEVEADHLTELPKIRTQYKTAVGSTVSVGVGLKVSEADKALLAAKVRGGDQIQLYTEEVEDIISELEEKTEGAKLQEEYLDPSTGLRKDAKFEGANAGIAGQKRPSMQHGDSSEVQATQDVIDQAPQGPVDYEQMFHQAAQAQQMKDAAQPEQGDPQAQQKLRETVVQILQQVKAHGPELEEMRSTNPELYQSVTGLVQAMIAMAREVFTPGATAEEPKQAEPVEKAALDPGKTGRHQVVLPTGSQIDPSPEANHRSGQIKVAKPDGKTTWRSVRANVVMDPSDGTPTSSRNV